MAEQLSVRPKPGIAFPRAAPLAGFVGYELATGDPDPEDHVVPGGPRFRLNEEAELVPNNVYYRRALARGDLGVAEEAEESTAHDEPPSDEELPQPAVDPSAPGESEG